MTKLAPKILLLGCGYTLRRVAANQDPSSIVIVVRSSESAAQLKEMYPHVHALSTESLVDLTDLLTAYPSLECVVDGIPPFRETDVGETALEYATRGVSNTIAALNQVSAVRRIVYLSTTGVYGVTDGSIVSERTAIQPQHNRSESRAASEDLYRSQAIPTSIVRIAAIYGPGRGIGTALRAGRFKLLDDGLQWSNRIQVEDLSNLICAVIAAEHPPALLCASDGNPALQKDVVDYYCAAFHLPHPESTTRAELTQAGSFTRLSNQRVKSEYAHHVMPEFVYPDYKAGAHTEFETD